MENIFHGIVMLNSLDLNCWSSLRLSLARLSILNFGNQQEDLCYPVASLTLFPPYPFVSLVSAKDFVGYSSIVFLFVAFIYIVSSRVNLAFKLSHAFVNLYQTCFCWSLAGDSLSNLNHSFAAAAASFSFFTLSAQLLFSFGALFGLVCVFY